MPHPWGTNPGLPGSYEVNSCFVAAILDAIVGKLVELLNDTSDPIIYIYDQSN